MRRSSTREAAQGQGLTLRVDVVNVVDRKRREAGAEVLEANPVRILVTLQLIHPVVQEHHAHRLLEGDRHQQRIEPFLGPDAAVRA